jgi:hypothetical protein
MYTNWISSPSLSRQCPLVYQEKLSDVTNDIVEALRQMKLGCWR